MGSWAAAGSRDAAGPRAAEAARAQRDAVQIGWIDEQPISRELLDARLASLRSGPRAGALPASGSSEDRQLTRWTAQVLFTEQICRLEARRRELTPGTPAELDPVGAVQLGSINAAAWRSCPEVSAVFEAVTSSPQLPDVAAWARVDAVTLARLRHGERLREFARWLDRRRSESLRHAPGFEHPGDPSQPDNTHRH